MKELGYVNVEWSPKFALQKVIEEQIKKEDLIVFSKQPNQEISKYKGTKLFNWDDVTRSVFSKQTYKHHFRSALP